MATHARKPFDVHLSKDQRDAFALDLSQLLDEALQARSASDAELEYWHTLYEQGRTRVGQHSPWADAADLTSYLGTQYIDVLRSQIVRTVMQDPVFVVEGYGEAEPRAPIVEEFHSWQLEAEGFQQAFARAAHLSLIEPRGVIEVYEDTVRRPVRKLIRAAVRTAPDGTILLDAKMQPQVQQDAQGRFVEELDESRPSVEAEIDSTELVARGPRERTIAYRDYLQFPGHAVEKTEVFGHAKRFWRRVSDLEERADQGVYDAEAVESLGTDDEHASATTLSGEPLTVASKLDRRQAEKELWELLILWDLDGKGQRWYVVTLHKDQRVILRVQYDDIGRPRYFSLVPFPRPNSTEGYSYIGHKLITVIEEHTAWRNMLADRASLQLQAPLLRRQGALWDPDLQPIGPKAVITVRDMQEISALQLPDATGPAIERIRDAERAGERLSGINDAAAGLGSEERRTLGEIQLITQQSLGRSTEAIQNLQETLEDIAQVRHLMWKRALREMGQDGLELPPSILQGLELRSPNLIELLPEHRITSQMLEGTFRFKPRGSVEDADLNRQRYDFNSWLQAMATMARLNPMIAAVLQTPKAAKALIEQGLRLYNVQDKQAFLGSEAMTAMQNLLGMQQQQALMPAPSAPGLPPPGAAPPAQPFGAF